MANMTTAFMDLAPVNATTDPYKSTLSEIEDSLGHNALARIGYFYPIRVAETVVGLMGNLMVIIAVGRYEDLQTATGSLLANLAVADAIACSLTVMSIIGETMERTSRWLAFCISKETFYVVAAFGNILSFTMMSIDRLICLSAPFWYKANMTISKVLPWQIIVWIGIILTYSLAFTLRSTATFSIPTCFYAFIISAQDIRTFLLYPFYFFTGITIFNYIILCWMVWRQGRQVALQSSTVGNHMMRRQRKLTKTTALVLLAYLAVTVPNSIISIVVKEESTALVHLQYVALLLWHFNSVINPFIYAYRMPKFHLAFRKMLGLKSNAVAPAPGLQAAEGGGAVQVITVATTGSS